MSHIAGDTSLLFELLDGQFSQLFSLRGTMRLGHLSRLLAFIKKDARLAGLLEDARLEASAARRSYGQSDRGIRRELGDLWSTHRAEVEQTLRTVEDDALYVFGDIIGYATRLCNPPPVTLPNDDDKTPRERDTERLLQALRHWTEWIDHLAQEGKAQPTEALRALRDTITPLSWRYKYASQCLHEEAKSLLWPVYRRLVRYSKLANPKPPKSNDLVPWVAHDRACKLANVLRQADDGDIADFERHEIAEIYSAIDTDARLLHEELRHRLRVARSYLAIVLRYAARCESFDADELRARCARDPANAERHLTLHLARYVFDQGLRPLIDPTISGLRPDVLHLGTGAPLYIEAKQYNSDHPTGALKRAYSQVWSTWSRLRKIAPANEAFLVVFRRGGPLVELPPTLRLGGLKLHSVLADISKKGGSREDKAAVRILKSDVLPLTSSKTPTAMRRQSIKAQDGSQ